MISASFEPIGKAASIKNPLNHPSLALFIGPTRSGKTTAMLRYLAALSDAVDFDEVLFVSANKKDDLLDELSDDVEITSDPVRLEDWMLAVMKARNPKRRNKLLVLDDLQGSNRWNGLMTPRSQFAEFVVNMRHINVWIVAACQTFKGCFGPTIRKQASMYFLFPPRGATEMKTIESEIDAPLEQIRMGFKMVKAREGKNFLYINLQDRHPRFYINFNEELDV